MKFAKLTDLNGHDIYVSPYLTIMQPPPGVYGPHAQSVLVSTANLAVREDPATVARILGETLQLELVRD